MFLKNAWYCAGWDYQISQGKDAIVARKIAGKRVVLYRKLGGQVVAMEDQCPHRQAALSLGRKEGDALRCMYHGLRFEPDGKCSEIPNIEKVPDQICVKTYPVVEKDNWVWVWMGDPDKADPSLICDAVGPSNPDYTTRPSYIQVNANYLLENANLADLSHLAFTHDGSIAMGLTTAFAKQTHKVISRGIKTDYWVRNAPLPKFVQHLFPSEFRCDAHFDITQTYPCNWVMHFRVFTAGTATEGESNGQLVLDSWTSQAVTPRDMESVDYYYSWGVSRRTEQPGLADLLKEGLDVAFDEDRRMLEAQQQRIQEDPHFRQMGIGAADAGPARMLRVIDQLIRDEQEAELAAAKAA